MDLHTTDSQRRRHSDIPMRNESILQQETEETAILSPTTTDTTDITDITEGGDQVNNENDNENDIENDIENGIDIENSFDDGYDYDAEHEYNYIVATFVDALDILKDVKGIEAQLGPEYGLHSINNELVKSRLFECCEKIRNQDVEDKFRYIISSLESQYNYTWEKYKPVICGICLEPYENESILMNKCKHVFCKKCIHYISKDTNCVKCPKCREISQYETIYL